MEVVVTTGAIRRAKLQSRCRHQQTNTQFLQAGCHSCRPTNGIQAPKTMHCLAVNREGKSVVANWLIQINLEIWLLKGVCVCLHG